jgi:serine/threonine protein kinase
MQATTHSVPANELLTGQLVGNYRLTDVLGEGGMAVVYLGEHQVIPRKAAVKVLRPECASSSELCARFLNEAKAVAAARSPYILELFELGSTVDGQPYLIMERLDGISLDAALQVGPLRPKQAMRILAKIAEALRAAHAVGVVHRDLKPANVYVVADEMTGEESVRVIDFGVAKLGEALSGARLTQTGCVLGTPTYMSPEQCRGETVDERSDVYSLGSLLYEMLTGRPPFLGENIGELMGHQLATIPDPPYQHSEQVSKPLSDLVMKALAKDPNERYQTMTDFRKVAEEWLATQIEQPGEEESSVLDRRAFVVGESDAEPTIVNNRAQTAVPFSPMIERAKSRSDATSSGDFAELLPLPSEAFGARTAADPNFGGFAYSGWSPVANNPWTARWSLIDHRVWAVLGAILTVLICVAVAMA